MKGSWKEIGIREKMQIINGTALTFAAIVLYFLAFIITLTIQYPIVSAGAALLASALAYFGITAFVKTQMINFETSIDERLKKIELQEQQNIKRDKK
jgi:hypothetical protein